MTHPPPRRVSTPVPTAPPPPPDVEPAVTGLVKRLEGYKALIAIAVGLVGVGGYTAAYLDEIATVQQVDQVRAGAAAQVEQAQATTTAQLGTLQAQVQDLRVRSAGVDQALADLHRDVAQLDDKVDELYLQLVEIAKATGARRVPPRKGPP